MRHLNAKQNSSSSYQDNSEYENLMLIAIAHQLGLEEEMDLLNEVRKGKSDLIDQLVVSSEVIILKVIKQYAPEREDLEKMIGTCKTVLHKLAENEINNLGRARFLRFRAWNVKQALLKM